MQMKEFLVYNRLLSVV